MPRTFVIMGSGETTPGMLAVHRGVFAGLPPDPRCRLLDSPFAFQENADELVERIGQYFRESLGQQVERVRLPVRADELTLERALAEVRTADWLFAGPGSPSYARRCWAGTPMPEAMAEVVAPGRDAALVVASAAAVTLGDWALPVYEIYKVGEDPRWEPGLGLMARILGWRCAVVPHYDNREGGTHDTRFCYVGGRRLSRIEPELDGGFILGVDEHTALLVDLDAGTVTVTGRGGATLRVAGAEDVLPGGSELPLAEVEARIAALGAPGAVPAGRRGAGRSGGRSAGDDQGGPEVADRVVPPAVEAAKAADADAEPDGATGSTTDPSSPLPVDDLARAVLGALPTDAGEARGQLVELAARAEAAAQDHSRELAAQLVEALVGIRSERRAARDWVGSDQLRDLLAEVGVEVRDGAEGSTWQWS